MINLDGVVDPEASRAFREKRLAEYARERGITHIADWPINLRAFVDHSGADPDAVKLRVIGEATPQGRDRFQLAELSYRSDRATSSPR